MARYFHFVGVVRNGVASISALRPVSWQHISTEKVRRVVRGLGVVDGHDGFKVIQLGAFRAGFFASRIAIRAVFERMVIESDIGDLGPPTTLLARYLPEHIKEPAHETFPFTLGASDVLFDLLGILDLSLP